MPLRKIFSWYWRVVHVYRWHFASAMLFYGAGTIFGNILPPIIYKNIVDILSVSTRDSAVRDSVWTWVALLGGTYFGTYIFFRLGDFFYFFSQSRALRDIACFTFERLQFHSYRFFSNRFSGSLISQARRYVDAFSSLQDVFTWTIWMQSLTLLGSFIGIFIFSPLLAMAFFGGIVFIFLLTLPLLRLRRKYDDAESEEDSKVTGRLSDVIANIFTVKVFSAGKKENATFRDYANAQEGARRNSSKAFMIMSAVQNALILLFEFFGMTFSVWLWYREDITVGTVVLVQAYLFGVFGMIWQMTRAISEILRASARASEMIEVFETPIDVADVEHPEDDRICHGRIEFRDLEFRYDEGAPVFQNFSLTVEKGEKVGIVGPSGAGKSTITKLLLRFADPQEGGVFIDGQKIQNMRQDDFRRHIAYVSQEPLLFHRTLRENIAYGKLDASEEDIVEAAKKAESHEFISRLPKGYDTLVGERGVKLSGGERQRVAIARALLKDAEILVLDEATSSLDSESEHAIQEALDDLMLGKTVIVIAHRLSTIKKLDRIIVLNRDGRIEESGAHVELLERNGLYATLWNRQTGGFIDEDIEKSYTQMEEEKIIG